MSSLLLPDLTPNLSRVRAIVTTKWGASSYRPLVITNVESYYVDTALDSDADTWTVEIGDPQGQYLDLLKRDSEVRVQLFGVGQEATNFLMTGLADEVEFDEQGILTLTGRDLSALALDSTIPPTKFSHVRAWYLVENQARKLGFRQTSLTRKPMTKKVQTTDGNENYWEFWYRLYRKEKMWLWTTANGILVAAPLDYGQSPTYYFGRPTGSESPNIKERYIPVISASIRKSTQSRIYEVWVYGQKGDTGFFSKSTDPTIADWIKKPLRIFQDTDAHTERSAQRLGWNEIFEGKVGSLEVKVTIPDPGFVIKPNRVAIIRIPEIGFAGDFYVVGVRYAGGPDGFYQEVRLRERGMALSSRTPKDPKVSTTEAPRTKAASQGLGEIIGDVASMPPAWIAYFISAAKEWHGPWDFNLFLATLLGICHQETGGTFMNIRANGGPGGSHIEWYPWKVARTQRPLTYGDAVGDKLFPGIAKDRPKPGVKLDMHGRTHEQYEEIFANEPGKYTSKTWAVGLMQLYTLSFKQDADNHMRANFHDQYAGGRWHPEHSIWAAAKALRQFLKNMVKDSGRDIDIWAGVSGYGQHESGEGANTVPTVYAQHVKVLVLKDPGYFSSVSDALKSVRDSAAAAQDGYTEPQTNTDAGTVSDGLPTESEVNAFLGIGG